MQDAEIGQPAYARPEHGVLSKVVLLSMPRTGSTMVGLQLDTHPKVKFLGSIFSKRGWRVKAEGEPGIGWEDAVRNYDELHEGLTAEWDDLDYRVANHQALLAKWFAVARPGECVGLKHHLSGAPEVTQSIIADPQIGKIVLTRSNLLGCYSSNTIVRLKAAQAAGKSGSGKAHFSPADFEQYSRRRQRIYDRWRPKIASGGGPWIEIDYIEARQRSGIGRLMRFIGLDPNELAPAPSRKRNSDDLLSRFENPDDVLRYLEENGLEHWRLESASDDEPTLSPQSSNHLSPSRQLPYSNN